MAGHGLGVLKGLNDSTPKFEELALVQCSAFPILYIHGAAVTNRGWGHLGVRAHCLYSVIDWEGLLSECRSVGVRLSDHMIVVYPLGGLHSLRGHPLVITELAIPAVGSLLWTE